MAFCVGRGWISSLCHPIRIGNRPRRSFRTWCDGWHPTATAATAVSAMRICLVAFAHACRFCTSFMGCAQVLCFASTLCTRHTLWERCSQSPAARACDSFLFRVRAMPLGDSGWRRKAWHPRGKPRRRKANLRHLEPLTPRDRVLCRGRPPWCTQSQGVGEVADRAFRAPLKPARAGMRYPRCARRRIGIARTVCRTRLMFRASPPA